MRSSRPPVAGTRLRCCGQRRSRRRPRATSTGCSWSRDELGRISRDTSDAALTLLAPTPKHSGLATQMPNPEALYELVHPTICSRMPLPAPRAGTPGKPLLMKSAGRHRAWARSARRLPRPRTAADVRQFSAGAAALLIGPEPNIATFELSRAVRSAWTGFASMRTLGGHATTNPPISPGSSTTSRAWPPIPNTNPDDCGPGTASRPSIWLHLSARRGSRPPYAVRRGPPCARHLCTRCAS